MTDDPRSASSRATHAPMTPPPTTSTSARPFTLLAAIERARLPPAPQARRGPHGAADDLRPRPRRLLGGHRHATRADATPRARRPCARRVFPGVPGERAREREPALRERRLRRAR